MTLLSAINVANTGKTDRPHQAELPIPPVSTLLPGGSTINRLYL
jgi:hypothetical protein